MTWTHVIPEQTVTDALTRRMPESGGGGVGANEGGEFPELLGKLAEFAVAEPQAGAQPANADTAAIDVARGASAQAGLPLHLRLGHAVKLAGAELPSSPQMLAADAAAQAEKEAALPVAGTEMTGKPNGMPSEVAAELHAAGQLRGEDQDLWMDAELSGEPRTDAPAQMPPKIPAEGAVSSSEASAMVAGSSGTAIALSDFRSPLRATTPRGEMSMHTATEARAKGKLVEVRLKIAAGEQVPATGEWPGEVIASTDVSGNQAKGDDAETAQIQQMRATVVRTETHLPPAGSATPMRQVVERIEAALGGAEDADRRDAELGTRSDLAASARPAPALKVLHIQLQPAELGTVTVRMSLKQDALELQLDVRNQEPAQLLRRDQEVIAKALQSAGYSLDGLSVQVVEADRVAGGAQHGAQSSHGNGQSPAQAQPDWSRSDGQPSDMQRQEWQEPRRRFAQPEAAADARTGSRAPTGDVYL